MIPKSGNRFSEKIMPNQSNYILGRSPSSEVGADRSLRQGRLRLRRHVASRLAVVPAGRDLGLAGDAGLPEIDEYSLARVFKAANSIDTLIVGTGTEVWLPPRGLREALRAVHVVLDAMQTGPAIRTYNIMLGERRRVAAALIAVP